MKAQFYVDISKFRDRMGESVQKKTERLTQKVVDKLIAISPVYTGNFRQSWNVSENTPNFVTVKSGDPNSPLPPISLSVKAVSKFPVLFITNGQPYGAILENGNHRQAPYAMIKTTLVGLR